MLCAVFPGMLCAVFPGRIALDSLDGMKGFTIYSLSDFDRSGTSVAGAGDVNGNGVGDIIIGGIGENSAGRTYVIFGNTSSPDASALSSLGGTNGFTIAWDNNQPCLSVRDPGFSVAGAGDLNGAGVDDLIIRADLYDAAGVSRGSRYVIFGWTSFQDVLELSSLNGMNGFTITSMFSGDLSGSSVASAGDVNGDGMADIIIGAPYTFDDQDPRDRWLHQDPEWDELLHHRRCHLGRPLPQLGRGRRRRERRRHRRRHHRSALRRPIWLGELIELCDLWPGILPRRDLAQQPERNEQLHHRRRCPV
jgi:hypothetical protein